MKKLIVANWKLNPETLREAKELLAPIKAALKKLNKVEAIICPPFLFLGELASATQKTKGLSVGGQDAFWEATGAYTGEVSATMLRKAGTKYLILGHSERRARGDSDQEINFKLTAALKEGLKVILCVGEKERDQHGFYLKTLRQQLDEGLRGVTRRVWPQLMVAYEPLWAIGAQAAIADNPASFHEQALFIRKVVSDLAGNGTAHNLPVLYGGSVSIKNAGSFLELGAADGLLIGRESLRADHFIEILKLAENKAK